jgi:thiamine biosynthesis lipoprotein
MVLESKAKEILTISSPRQGVAKITFRALGTQCELQFVAENEELAEEFARASVSWVATFERKYSRFLPDSLISRINAQAGLGWVDVDADAEALFNLCQELHFTTGGILDPTALPVVALWYRNYKDKENNSEVPDPSVVKRALEKVGWNKVERESGRIRLPETGMSIDFGGFGKEYAVDKVAELGARYGIKDLLVDFGHDIRVIGRPPGSPLWHIGLEDPCKPGSCWSSLGVSDRGVATSGDYVRFFVKDGVRYGHIIDPRNGYPVSNGCRGITVVAGSCLEAGVLSTTSFVKGSVEGLTFMDEFFGAEGCIVTEGRNHQTRRFYEYVVPTE